MALNNVFKKAISNIESGGRYDLLGPITKNGDRAYGKYQVMGANIGPWTKQYYGKELTPKEFLANPEAQEAVFKGKFLGEYVPKYGPEGAARAWFAGEGGMNDPGRKDILGTSVQSYSDKFMKNIGKPSGKQKAQTKAKKQAEQPNPFQLVSNPAQAQVDTSVLSLPPLQNQGNNPNPGQQFLNFMIKMIENARKNNRSV